MAEETIQINLIDGLFGDKEEFLSRAKIIFKIFTEELEGYSDSLNLRAITTLAVINDLKSYPETSIENIIFRGSLYVNAIIDHYEIIMSAESNEEKLFACMAVFAESPNDEDKNAKYMDKEQEVEELLEEFVLTEIERVLWSAEEPSLLAMLKQEIRKTISKDRKLGISYLLGNIEQIQKELRKSVSQLKEQVKKLGSDMHKKEMGQIVKTFMLKLQNKMKDLSQNQQQANQIRIRRTSLFKAFQTRRVVIRAKKQIAKSQRTSGRDELYNMLHSHQPSKNVKTRATHGEKDVLREARTLLRSGMSATSASESTLNKRDMNVSKHSFKETLLAKKDKQKNLVPSF